MARSAAGTGYASLLSSRKFASLSNLRFGGGLGGYSSVVRWLISQPESATTLAAASVIFAAFMASRAGRWCEL
jgi:hypothetical protein